jgi:hypothetical protein
VLVFLMLTLVIMLLPFNSNCLTFTEGMLSLGPRRLFNALVSRDG